jgi:hypothetical protein
MRSKVHPAIDSLIAASDSTNDFLRDVDTTLSNTIDQVKSQIARLNARKKAIESKIENEPIYMAMVQSEDYKPTDDKDKEIYRLRQKILDYEREIAKLKNRLFYDSMGRVGKIEYDKVPNEEMPNDKSLVITLNKKLRGDGDISEQGVSVYIMKYTKKAKKVFKGYANCQQKDLNLLDAKEASYYRGQYFFNDIEPGEYLIKVCALYGNWMVINKKDYKQEIEILMSPPIQ